MFGDEGGVSEEMIYQKDSGSYELFVFMSAGVGTKGATSRKEKVT